MGDNFDPNIIDTDSLAEEVAELAKQWSRKPAVKRNRAT
jgi:hypothetical protein